jgi:hypothetical protein
MSGMGDELPVAWMIDGFDTDDNLHQPGIMLADVLDQLGLGIRWSRNENRASICNRLSDSLKEGVILRGVQPKSGTHPPAHRHFRLRIGIFTGATGQDRREEVKAAFNADPTRQGDRRRDRCRAARACPGGNGRRGEGAPRAAAERRKRATTGARGVAHSGRSQCGRSPACRRRCHGARGDSTRPYAREPWAT